MTSIAIAHDYLTQRGGAERVVLALHREFPEATIHTTLYDAGGTYPEFRDARIVTSPLNRVGLFRHSHRAALPFLAGAASRLRIDADVVIASSSGWAHGFDIRGKSLIYCHAPARWLYQPREYLGGPMYASGPGLALAALRPALTGWDRRAAKRADRYLCNSRVVRDRVAQAYGIDAALVHAPLSLDVAGVAQPVPDLVDWAESGYLLVVSRLLPYKNVDQVIEAVRGLDERLVVVGAGPERHRLERLLPENARIVTHLTDSQIRWTYAHASTLIAPSLEDYGLTPLEGGAYGKPTLALRAGGYLDTVVEGVTGLFFDAATPESVRGAIHEVRQRTWDLDAIAHHMTQFTEARFADRLRAEVADLLGAGDLRKSG
jgi:glycosyltransferase involved in cell wall biosynthesis